MHEEMTFVLFFMILFLSTLKSDVPEGQSGG